MENLDKFNGLSEEKKNEIINSAMFVFGNVGYKKAYISEIAEMSGISKSMIFYYFGNKKRLYLYLLDLSFHEISDPFDDESLFDEKDFFQRIINAIEIKMKVLKKRPSVLKFLTSYYFETDKEVEKERKIYMEKSAKMQSRFAFTDINKEKFKESVNVEVLLKMMLRWTEGYIAVLQNTNMYNSLEEMEKFYDVMLEEFYESFEMMRLNFYKEDYL